MLQRKVRALRFGTEATLDRELQLRVEAAGVPTYRQSIPAIFAELRRCRRYEHPMAVLVTGLDTGQDANAETSIRPASRVDLVTFLILGSLLQDVTRESDIVTYAAQEHLYALFLPECDENAALHAARRLAIAFHARTGERIRAGVAVFPGNGLIVDALFDHALNAYATARAVSIDAEPAEHEVWPNVRSAR